MLAQIIMLLVVTMAGLVCLGWALWYTALWLSGYTCWDAVGWSVFMYQFGAVICAVFAVGYWNYLSETRAKSILLSLLGVLFFVNLNISFAVPFCSESGVPPAAAVAWYGNPRTCSACLYARDGGYLFSVSLKED